MKNKYSFIIAVIAATCILATGCEKDEMKSESSVDTTSVTTTTSTTSSTTTTTTTMATTTKKTSTTTTSATTTSKTTTTKEKAEAETDVDKSIEETEISNEDTVTTRKPVTTKPANTTQKPQTTKAPETTQKPQTTKAPETTQKPKTTKASVTTTTTTKKSSTTSGNSKWKYGTILDYDPSETDPNEFGRWALVTVTVNSDKSISIFSLWNVDYQIISNYFNSVGYPTIYNEPLSYYFCLG